VIPTLRYAAAAVLPRQSFTTMTGPSFCQPLLLQRALINSHSSTLQWVDWSSSADSLDSALYHQNKRRFCSGFRHRLTKPEAVIIDIMVAGRLKQASVSLCWYVGSGTLASVGTWWHFGGISCDVGRISTPSKGLLTTRKHHSKLR
jgi:hypothetical protein